MFDIIADHGIRPSRQRAPVRRHSYPKGQEVGTFWRPIDRRTANRIYEAAVEFDCAHKQSGHKNGPLGHIALEILRLFTTKLVNFKSGRLDPALDYMQRRLRRSRAAIVRALAALRRHGFLDWRRRYEMTGEEGRGQPPRQISNAYRLVLPAIAAALLGFFGRNPPPPDDVEAARTDAAALVAVQEREVAALEAEWLASLPRSMPDYSGDRIVISDALSRSPMIRGHG